MYVRKRDLRCRSGGLMADISFAENQLRLTIQLGRPGWVTNFAVPEAPQPGQVREAVTQVLAGRGVPGALRPGELVNG